MTTPYEEGDPASKICIVAEAPGRSEMRLNRPLVGPSGQLLESCMHSAKMVRRECYLLNIFPKIVYKDKTGKNVKTPDGDILWTSKDGLTLLGQELAAPYLKRLSSCDANVVVPLGGTALSCLFGDSRIMKWRGSILYAKKEASGKKLVPTVHPAACLRGQYLWRHLLISDLDRAKKESKSPSLNLTKRDLQVGPDFQQVRNYLSECAKLGAVAFDIEVTNHQVHCIAFAKSAYDCMSVPIVKGNGADYWTIEQEEQIWLLISAVLGNSKILKIGQNLIFDISFLLQQMNIHTSGQVGDTMILHHIMYPDFPKGLDFLCSMHTREPYYKDEGKIWKNPGRDVESFWLYNAKDAATTFEIWDVLSKDAEKSGFMKTYWDTVEMFPSLLYMMIRGFGIDTERLQATKIEVEAKIKEKQDELDKVADHPFNISSPKQVQNYFYLEKGIKPYISRTTGRPTTDDKAMSRIYRRYNLPEAKLVQEIRALSKLHGTYLEVKFDKDGRIRCSYNPRGATTGRLSSSKTIFGTGMNLQNLHPDFKGFLVADS
jgi:uracil-DNA glycosylase